MLIRKVAEPALYAILLVAGFFVVAGVVQATDEHAHFDPTTGLLVSTRDELRVCVATIGQVDAARLDAKLSAALQVVRGHRQWTDAGYSEVPQPERRCTAGLPATGVAKGVVVGPGMTDDPGPYRTVVVVLDDVTASRSLGQQQAVLAPWELMLVRDREAATVTQAVVVRAAFLDDPRFALDYLTSAVGLDPATR